MEETLKFVLNEERQKEIKKLIAKGFQWRCLKCGTVFMDKRAESYEEWYGGRPLGMCACECDLFQKLSETTCLDVAVRPVAGTLVFKEHHAKYCQCEKGKILTGDSETECHANFRALQRNKHSKTYLCLKSGLKIVILRSTQEELEKPDELGSVFLRIPR